MKYPDEVIKILGDVNIKSDYIYQQMASPLLDYDYDYDLIFKDVVASKGNEENKKENFAFHYCRSKK